MIEKPIWFGPPDRALFGWFCLPDNGRASLAVLLCAPIGEEEHNAHETFRRLAATLAAQGMASLRFDYHGTGDSLGRWSDPGRGEAWLASIRDAYEAIGRLGIAKIAGVGMRIGATLAATAAQEGLIDLAALVLWDPCSGKSMLREGKARRPNQVPPPPGAVDTPGYLYEADAVADLRAVDPATLAPGPLAPHVLVLTRNDRPMSRPLRKRLDDPRIEWAEAVGQSELLDLPMTDNVVPTDSLARIVTWLRQHDTDAPVPVVLAASNEIIFRTAPDQRPLTERTVSLGGMDLFGITTEPDCPPRGPLLVLINVASDRHVGPGRRWVDSARTWADMGFRVLRIDQSGTGDSPCRGGQEFGVLYAREWLDDLPHALRSLPCSESGIALISLCSGAYSAMETAFQFPVALIYPINVILHAQITSKASALYDPRRLAARPPSSPFLRLYRRHPRAAALLWRLYRQVTVWNSPMAAVSALVRRGTDVVLVMSPNDGHHFTESVFWTIYQTWRIRRSGNYRLLLSRKIDHALMTQEGQDWALSAITTDLVARYPLRAHAARAQPRPERAAGAVRRRGSGRGVSRSTVGRAGSAHYFDRVN